MSKRHKKNKLFTLSLEHDSYAPHFEYVSLGHKSHRGKRWRRQLGHKTAYYD